MGGENFRYLSYYWCTVVVGSWKHVVGDRIVQERGEEDFLWPFSGNDFCMDFSGNGVL
jgi:hypothetical protein